jgi:hypothetical protein
VLLAVYGTRLMQDVVCCIHNYCYTEQVLLNVLETGLCCFELLPTFSANQLQTLRRVWIGYVHNMYDMYMLQDLRSDNLPQGDPGKPKLIYTDVMCVICRGKRLRKRRQVLCVGVIVMQCETKCCTAASMLPQARSRTF